MVLAPAALAGCGSGGGSPPPPFTATAGNPVVTIPQLGTYKVDWSVPGCTAPIVLYLADAAAMQNYRATGVVTAPIFNLGPGPLGTAQKSISGNETGFSVTIFLSPSSCASSNWSVTFAWQNDNQS
jgi:hypothetical protein